MIPAGGDGQPKGVEWGASRLFAVLMVVSPALFIVFAYFYVMGLHPVLGFWRDGAEYVVGRDFSNGWMMGRAALTEAQPAVNYDIATYSNKLRAVFGADYRWQQWSYPPSYMLLMAPFAGLPYMAAWALFMLGSVAVFSAVVWRCCRAGLLLLLTSPAAFICLVSGQVSLLAAAVQLGIFRLLDTRPILAGMLLGLLSLKPQIGLVYPFFLIATRRWKVFAAAALTTVGIAALTAALFGVELWRAYVLHGIPLQNLVLRQPVDVIQWLMPTLFMDLRSIGATYLQAMGGQMAAAALAVASLFSGRFRRADALSQMLLVAAAGVLATPYLMAYDLLFFTCALVMYGRAHPVGAKGAVLIAGCFFLPFIHYIVGQYNVPGSALLPLLLMGWVLYRSGRQAA